jgi:hypothetical protein
MTQPPRCQVELGASLRQVADELRMLFGPLLGEYQRPSGPPIQAFWTVGRGQVRPSYTATGIEAVLSEAPERDLLGPPTRLMAVKRIWTLTFTQFDTSSNLEAVRLLAFRAWPTAQQRPQPQTDDTFERLILELPDPVYIASLAATG